MMMFVSCVYMHPAYICNFSCQRVRARAAPPPRRRRRPLAAEVLPPALACRRQAAARPELAHAGKRCASARAPHRAAAPIRFSHAAPYSRPPPQPSGHPQGRLYIYYKLTGKSDLHVNLSLPRLPNPLTTPKGQPGHRRYE